MKRRTLPHAPSEFHELSKWRKEAHRLANRDEEPFVLIRIGRVTQAIAKRKCESFIAAHGGCVVEDVSPEARRS